MKVIRLMLALPLVVAAVILMGLAQLIGGKP